MIHRRGFATYVALILLGMMGLVIASTVAYLHADLARTADEVTQTQLRQLLMSGEKAVADQLARTNAAITGPLPLSAALSDAALAVRVTPQPPDAVLVTVEARMAGESAVQHLTYRKLDNAWKLIAAVLE